MDSEPPPYSLRASLDPMRFLPMSELVEACESLSFKRATDPRTKFFEQILIAVAEENREFGLRHGSAGTVCALDFQFGRAYSALTKAAASTIFYSKTFSWPCYADEATLTTFNTTEVTAKNRDRSPWDDSVIKEGIEEARETARKNLQYAFGGTAERRNTDAAITIIAAANLYGVLKVHRPNKVTIDVN